jgi:non-specific serine/threonine protein kinase
MTGLMLDHYRILDRIGTGGMGEVFRAIDRRSGRPVAIKVPLPQFRSGPEHRTRLRREARAMAALRHPNICALRASGQWNGTGYLVMPLLEGRTLRRWMGGRPLPMSFLLKVALQVARALAAAHARGVIHRDIKPENVFITRRGIVKLLDFGLARHLTVETAAQAGRRGAEVSASRCETLSADSLPVHHRAGTLSYMSPEQARGEAIDHRSDLFSFGVVLYEMATGSRPFDGRTWADVLASVLKDDPPPPSTISGRRHRGLDRLVRWCLVKDRTARCRSASEIVARLDRLRPGSRGPETTVATQT